MTSQAKVEAIRGNAQNSTAPKTQEGKDKGRLIALKHGPTAATLVLSHEDAEAH